VHYRAYGITLSSSIAFPELTPIPACRVRLTFRLGSGRIDSQDWVDGTPSIHSDGGPWLTVARQGRAYRLRFGESADLVIMQDGRTVVGYRRGRTTLATIRHLFLDSALPMLLSHRGRTVLHGSAVVCGGAAVALIGPGGAGKSTLAASFSADGCPVIADDAVVLRQREGVVITTPAYAGLRIWPDALTVLGGAQRRLKASDASRKRRIGLGDPGFAFQNRPAPLRRVYILDSPPNRRSKTIRIEALSRREGIIELIKYSYAMDLNDRRHLVNRLDRLLRDCAPLELRRLRYPRDLSALPNVQAAILHDLDSGQSL
jgi:hypothetical protein